MKILRTFTDVCATALLLAGFFAAFFALGYVAHGTKVRADCDGLGVVLLTGDRYECVSSPRFNVTKVKP